VKGIVLAGGKGTRLYPLTLAMSKQLLPIYNKPMIYYPLSILMLAGIREILMVADPSNLPAYQSLLGDGSHLGIKISYVIQTEARGHVDGLLLGADFLEGDSVCFIFGDNVIYGHGVSGKVKDAAKLNDGALIFAYPVRDPERFGVVEFTPDGRVLSIEEKPAKPRTHFAIPGIYFYDSNVIDLARQVKPTARNNELEITELNKLYLAQGKLRVEMLGRGVAWLDAGTHASLLEASNFVQAVENRQGLMIACLEEIAYLKGYISRQDLLQLAEPMKNEYGDYLRRIADEQVHDLQERVAGG
jgi:glucose-1-phosphate thymidylyltransferase